MWESIFELSFLSGEILRMNFKLMSLLLLLLSQMIVLLILLCVLLIFILRLVIRSCVRRGEEGKFHVAFFHPYCNAGGGGERVLWKAIQAVQDRYANVECYVYTGDKDVSSVEILQNVRRRFNIWLTREPQFIYLNWRHITEAKNHPIFTLLMQSLSSVVLGAEALSKFRPDLFVDTMGFAFTYPLFRFFANCKVACYVHYPTISSDMLQRVSSGIEAHNNRAFISQSVILSYFKLVYYHLFALLYGLVGSCAHVVMVNSSWTRNHICSLWRFAPAVRTVFPPCDTDIFSRLEFVPDREKRSKTVVSIGQFRPEKDYPLQLRAFKRLLGLVGSESAAKLEMVLIGGVRNREDEARVRSLASLADELQISDKVTFKVNASFSELLSDVQNGTLGIHTMWNEHFGIGIVESMAGGLIMVAHDSGGPKLDIVIPYDGGITGLLASTEETYAESMKRILDMTEDERFEVRDRARRSASRFGEEVFENQFLSCLQNLIDERRSE